MADMDWAQLQQLAKDDEYVILPEDTYVLTIESASMKPTSKNNGWMLNMKCKVVNGVHAGKTQYASIYIPSPSADVKPGTYNMMNGKLNAVGVPLSALQASGATMEQVGLVFAGKTFLGTVKHSEWNGNKRAQVDGFAAYNGTAPAPSVTPPAAAGAGVTIPSSTAPKAPW